MALLDVNHPKLVQVLAGGVWRDGVLRAWQHLESRWRGYVTYSVGVGMCHVGWVDGDGLRRSQGGR